MSKHLIAPSVLAADYGFLGDDIKMLNESEADWVHIDIMDGVFVPNISFGMDVTKRIGELSKKPMDIHLMIVDPDRYFEDFKAAGAYSISVHYEACNHLHRSIQRIKELGLKAGVALNPHTPVSVLQNIIEEDLDVIILMSVNPGFGGQKLIKNIYRKTAELRSMLDERGKETIIEIDGGVNAETAPLLLKAGATSLVAGSYVFKSTDPKATISSLKALS